MVLKTGLPQIDNLALTSVSSLAATGIPLGLATLSLLVFFFHFLRKGEVFPEVSAPNSLAGLSFKDGRAPESYHWTRLLQQASKQVSSSLEVAPSKILLLTWHGQ